MHALSVAGPTTDKSISTMLTGYPDPGMASAYSSLSLQGDGSSELLCLLSCCLLALPKSTDGMFFSFPTLGVSRTISCLSCGHQEQSYPFKGSSHSICFNIPSSPPSGKTLIFLCKSILLTSTGTDLLCKCILEALL